MQDSFSRFGWRALLVCCFIQAAGAQTVSDQPPTDVRSVRQLSSEAAKKQQPVHLHGVVTALSGWKNSFFLQDSTGGISIDRNDQSPELKPGEEVEVEGVTGPGLFAPVAISNRVRILGSGRLSEAPVFELAELLEGQQDSQRIAIRGILRSAEVKSIWGRSVLYIRVETRTGQVAAQVLKFRPDFESLLDSEVLVRGVCGTNFNGACQLVGVRLFVPDLGDISIEKRGPADPYSTPLRSLHSLLQFQRSAGLGHRVRVRGVVTYQKPGKELYIQNGKEALAIRSLQSSPVKVGAEIEAVGFAVPGAFSPVLEDAVFRPTGQATSTRAIPIEAPKAIAQYDGFEAAPYNGLLVTLEAELLQQTITGHGQTFLLRQGKSLFTAGMERQLPAAGSSGVIDAGSILKVTGICRIETDQSGNPTSFQVLLRSPADVQIIRRPSWATSEHILWILGITLFFAGFALAAVYMLRKRVRRQIDQISTARGHYHRILETANDAFIETDSDGYITEWNRRAEQMFGWTREGTFGKKLAETVLPERLRAAHYAAIATMLKTRSSRVTDRPMELNALNREGREFPVELTIWAVEGSEGVRFNAFVRDISERRRAEQLLKRSEELNRQILQSSPDCIKVLSLQGQVMSMSAGGCRAMDVETPDAFLRREWASLWPEPGRKLAEASVRIAREGEEGGFQAFRPTVKGTPKWWDVRVAPIRNADGSAARILAISRDITKQKLAEGAADEAKSRLDLALRAAQIGTWTWNLATNILKWSEHCSALFGLEREPLTTDFDHLLRLIHPEDLDIVQRQVSAALAMGHYETEFRAVWADESVHVIAASGEVSYTDGKPVQLAGIYWDITARKQAERALQTSEAKLREAQEIAHVGHWEFDLTSHAITWSDETFRIFGLEKEQGITNERYQSMLPGDDRKRVLAAIAKTITTGEGYDLTHQICIPDGSIRHIECRGRLERGRDGQPSKLMGTALDVTSQVEAVLELQRSHEELEHRVVKRTAQLAESNAALQQGVEDLRRSEAQFRQLADSMPQIVWTAAPDGAVNYYNERWYAFTGFDRSLIGDQSWKPLLHSDDLQYCFDHWYASVKSGSPFEIEMRFWDRSSSTYRWHLGLALPIRDGEGEVLKWFGTCTDIDDYKRAQTQILALNSDLEFRVEERTQELSTTNEELTRTQTWLQSVLDSATEVSIIAIDNDGIIRLFNSGAERLLGYSADEVVGRHTPYILHPPAYCELLASEVSAKRKCVVSVDELFMAANQTDGSWVTEAAYLNRDGTFVETNLAVSAMTASNGERLGTLGIAVDIRPRKALERQLSDKNVQLEKQTSRAEEANRAKSDFLAAMSHEIRTPMNAILGMADLLWESELDTTQRQYVKVFRAAGANLLTLVNDILDLSKIEFGQFVLEQIDFDLEELIERTVEMIRPKTQAKRVDLIARIAPGVTSTLSGDPTRLQQILLNLLGNAIKFTESGEIALAIHADPSDSNRLHFEVSDTGIGIPADKLESIFDDFTQAESSTTRRFGGTGLGLGICRRLVSRMGGQLRVRSEFGKGSCFSFDALLEHGSQDKLRRPEPVTGLVGRRVLIVDNNATNRLIFAEMCHAWGMVASECSSAADALTALRTAERQQAFDLMIVDRLMPEMDGFELVSHLRRTAISLPVLMTTSDSVPGDQTRSHQLGIAGYAVKPVRRAELLRLVCRALVASDVHEEERATQFELATRELETMGVGRILIAEDSEDNQFLFEAYLKNTPYEITFVENGERAVNLARTQQFDLVLMDMQMPVMDGLTATKLIREAEQEEGGERVPVLALTANARKEDVEASRLAGCNAHISKPISKAKLLSTIEQYIRQPVTQPVGQPGSQASSKALGIDIPSGLEEAAKRYIHSRRDESARLRTLLGEKDFDQLRSLAHNIKGTGTSFGFPDLTRLGGLIERSAKEKNADDISAQLLELTAYVERAVGAVELMPN